MNQIETILKDLGLTELEIKIYKMLLDNGANSAGDISQKTGIHRRNVYDCLERLIQKGLVAYIKENNIKKYSITNPQRILDKLKERETEIASIMPELVTKFSAITQMKETLFFRGKNGLRQIFDDMLAEKKEILINGTTVKVSHILKYFFPKFELLRKQHKIHTRMIFDSKMKDSHSSEYIEKLALNQTRYIKDFNRSPMSQYIYGDNIAIIVWADDPIAILIRQKEIADGFRDNFEIMWRMAK